MQKAIILLSMLASQLVLAASPGGVAGENLNSLELWLRADVGVEATGGGVDAWDDQSEFTSNNVSQGTSNKRPIVGDDLAVDGETLNFNPTVMFDGSNDLLSTSTLQLDDGASIFAVAFNGLQSGGGSQFKPFIISQDGHGGSDQDEGFLLVAGRSDDNDGDVLFVPPHSASGDAEETTDFGDRTNRASMWLGLDDINNQDFVYRNGELRASNLSVPADPGAPYTTGYDIGGSSVSSGRQYVGAISEIIAFDEKLSAGKIAKVNSYLGIKYGITIFQQDYILSDDSLVWDYTNNTSYHNDVAGLATDSGSGLEQKISRSYTTDAANQAFSITMSTENIFDTLNTDPARPVALADKSALVWGHNGGTTAFNVSLMSAGDNKRINRIWRSQQTGTANSVFITIPKAVYDDGAGSPVPGKKFLLISSSEFQNSGGTLDTTSFEAVELIPHATNDYYSAEITFTGQQYFTLAIAPDPFLISIKRNSGANEAVDENATSLEYLFSFSEDVTNVDVADFIKTGDANALFDISSVSQVSGDASKYVVVYSRNATSISGTLDNYPIGVMLDSGFSIDEGTGLSAVGRDTTVGAISGVAGTTNESYNLDGDFDNDGTVNIDEEPGAENNQCLPTPNEGSCDADGDGVTNENEVAGEEHNPCAPVSGQACTAITTIKNYADNNGGSTAPTLSDFNQKLKFFTTSSF